MGHRIRRSGFTLIELLVTIGIIALLAALLFPVFARAREKGRQAVCLSNERHLGVAFLLYAQDNEETVPPDLDAWAAAIYPYAKSVGVFHCPSDATDAQAPYYPISYGINANLAYRVHTTTVFRYVARPITEASAKTVLFFEVVHSTAEVTTAQEGWDYDTGTAPRASSVAGYGNDFFCCAHETQEGVRHGYGLDINDNVRAATGLLSPGFDPTWGPQQGRHQDGANFAFLDTHVKWLPPGLVSSGEDARTPGGEEEYGFNVVPRAGGSENARFAATFSMK